MKTDTQYGRPVSQYILILKFNFISNSTSFETPVSVSRDRSDTPLWTYS